MMRPIERAMYGQKRRAVSLGSVTPLSHVVLMTVAPLPVPPQYRRFGLNRLDRLHRVSRETVRYEYPAPGDLLHLDVKKLGRVSLRPTHMCMSAAGAGVMTAVAPRR